MVRMNGDGAPSASIKRWTRVVQRCHKVSCSWKKAKCKQLEVELWCGTTDTDRGGNHVNADQIASPFCHHLFSSLLQRMNASEENPPRGGAVAFACLSLYWIGLAAYPAGLWVFVCRILPPCVEVLSRDFTSLHHLHNGSPLHRFPLVWRMMFGGKDDRPSRLLVPQDCCQLSSAMA
jgi:hypothetical protein